MRTFAFWLISLLTPAFGFSQSRVNLEFGGSAWTGVTFTIELHRHLTNEPIYYLIPKFGVGHTFFADNSMTAMGGLLVGREIGKQAIELGIETSYLFRSPFSYDVQASSQRKIYMSPIAIYKLHKGMMIYTAGVGVILPYNQDELGVFEYGNKVMPTVKFGVGF